MYKIVLVMSTLFLQPLVINGKSERKVLIILIYKSISNCQLCNTSFIHLSFIYKGTLVDRYTLEKEVAHSMSQIPCIIKGNLQLCALFLAHVNTD